jgi:hypothetical protein
MSSYWRAFIAVGLIGVGTLTGCVTKGDLGVLRKELEATQDSLTTLWDQTRTAVVALRMADTIIRPPKCPGPNCPKEWTAIVTAARLVFPPAPKWNRSQPSSP